MISNKKCSFNLSKRIDYYTVFVCGFAIVSQIAETPVTTASVTVRYWLSPCLTWRGLSFCWNIATSLGKIILLVVSMGDTLLPEF